jgi:ribosomal protein L11 methyltransferase
VRAWRLAGAAAAPLAAEGPVAAGLWDAGATAVWIDGDDLVAYYGDDSAVAPPGDGRWEPVAEVDHVAAYLAGLAPVDAGAVVVAPTHCDAVVRAGQQVVWLDPGTAFGTGHHASTRLALEALGRLHLAGRRVLDVGAGSGLLAIAADRLGAAEALGLDIDADTVPVARANAELNRSRARFVVGGFGDVDLEPCDVLLANLYAELHAAWLGAYAAVVAVGGDLLLSGILAPRDRLVRASLEALNAAAGATGGPRLASIDECRDGDWWLLHLRREA